jgi:hypothetical protein
MGQHKMSFDIFYRACNLGTRSEQRKNPFTREVRSVAIDDGLSAVEREGVLQLLRGVAGAPRDKSGAYSLDLPDGGSAELFVEGLDGTAKCTGCMVAIRSLTPALVSFLHDLSRAGNMVAMPAMEGPAVIVVDERQRQRVSSRWPDAVIIASPEELGHLLGGGFGAWQKYRDQVIARAKT